MKPVIGEFRQKVEDLVRLLLRDAALGGAGDEAPALGIHLRLDLLAHGAAQQVGIAERIAGELLGDLHHLLLIDDDAEGLAQDRGEFGQRIPLRLGLTAPVLALAIDRDIRHRTRTVECHQRDQILHPVSRHLDERLAHARRFHLEDADRLAPAQHVVGGLVIERDRGDVDALPAILRDQGRWRG